MNTRVWMAIGRMSAWVRRNGIGIVAALALTSAPALAANLVDDFEDGDLSGWLSATNGGVRTEGVELHNGSKMAFITQVGSANAFSSSTTQSSLTRDFQYSEDARLLFDMHAISNTGRNQFSTVHSGSGVKVTFLNVFNGVLGAAGLYNYTNPAMLTSTESAIDGSQHSYDVSMGDFASLAGLNPQNAAIAKVSLSFVAWAQFSGGGNIYPNAVAFSSVWFDNVAVAVPEPETYALTLAGVCILGLQTLRKRGLARAFANAV